MTFGKGKRGLRLFFQILLEIGESFKKSFSLYRSITKIRRVKNLYGFPLISPVAIVCTKLPQTIWFLIKEKVSKDFISFSFFKDKILFFNGKCIILHSFPPFFPIGERIWFYATNAKWHCKYYKLINIKSQINFKLSKT